MCGIAGILGGKYVLEDHLQAMALVLRHRDPDYYVVWLDADARVGFAHTRLSILDLSTTGHQSMPSTGVRFISVSNGEIYNYIEMRTRLQESGSAPN